jgi:hypothetical protein
MLEGDAGIKSAALPADAQLILGYLFLGDGPLPCKF